MIIRAPLYLTLGLIFAWSATVRLSYPACAFDGAPDSEIPPPRAFQGLPGVPSIKIQPGVRIFGPNGPIPPDLQSGGVNPADQLDKGPRSADHPEKKLTEAEKAEALRKALAPKPSVAVLRRQTLDLLFKQLATASDEEAAKTISATIEHIWAHSESDTANLLMDRGSASLAAGQYPLALSLFDKLIVLQPKWAEAWNKRATTRFRADDIEGAMADIDQVLKLEPRHYGALAGMGLILQKSNLNKQALDVFRKALALNPKQPELRKLIENLTIEVEGRDI